MRTAITALAFLAAPALAQPLTTAFTYQGELRESGTPASGAHDFQFLLFTAPAGGMQLGATLCADDVAVTDGTFSALLDFGAQFAGQTRYLEVHVRPDTGTNCSDTTGFVALSPRQQITAAPASTYALLAGSASSAANAFTLNGQPASFYTNAGNLTGTLPGPILSGPYANAVTLNNASNVFAGSGAGLTGLNASNIASGILSPARGGTGGDTTSAAVNQVLKWNGGAWAPANDLNTAYTAGAGLSLSGTMFSIPSGAIQAAMLGAGSVAGGAAGVVQDSSITSADLASDTASLAKVSGGALAASGSGVTAAGTVSAADFFYASPQTSHCMIAPAAFSARDGVPVYHTNGPDGGVHPAPTATSFNGLAAPVNLPHGATITAVHYYVVDNTASTDMFLSGIRQTVAGGLLTSFAAVNTSGASASIQTLSVTGLSITVDNSTTSYRILANTSGGWTGSAMFIRGVRIDYTMPRPAR
ncbi:MAG TPA: hypothetical protein VD971_13635 [Phycisphaerales bacterium]|nr:hypothetical protein [Phycisphaerales bacterium]